MFKNNYPATYLFLLSLALFIFLTLISPLVRIGGTYCAIALQIITFPLTFVCGFLLFFTLFDIKNFVSSKKLHH